MKQSEIKLTFSNSHTKINPNIWMMDRQTDRHDIIKPFLLLRLTYLKMWPVKQISLLIQWYFRTLLQYTLTQIIWYHKILSKQIKTFHVFSRIRFSWPLLSNYQLFISRRVSYSCKRGSGDRTTVGYILHQVHQTRGCKVEISSLVLLSFSYKQQKASSCFQVSKQLILMMI